MPELRRDPVAGRWVIIQEHLSDVQSNLNLQVADSMPGMNMPHSNP